MRQASGGRCEKGRSSDCSGKEAVFCCSILHYLKLAKLLTTNTPGDTLVHRTNVHRINAKERR
jgi:hypothetical protein